MYESFVTNHFIMTSCNPFSLYYVIQNYRSRKDPKYKYIKKFQSPDVKVLNDKFLRQRFMLRKHFLANPMFTVFQGITPAQAMDNEWVEVVANFSEAVNDTFVFIRAIQVETMKNYKEFF